MPKKESKKSSKPSIAQPLEMVAFITACFYVASVNTTLHQYLYWQNVTKPSVPLMGFSVLIVLFYGYKRKSLSALGLVTLAIVSTASIIWLTGFRANIP